MKSLNDKSFIIIRYLLKLFLVLLIGSNIQAQILGNLGSRNEVFSVANNEEYSGLAYHPDYDVFIMPTDDPIPGQSGIHFKGYHTSSQTQFYISLTNLTNLNDDDLEGLTYLEDDFFLLVEEDKSEVYFLKFNYDQQNLSNSTFTVINSISLLPNIPLGDFGNNGLEGVSYDPVLEKLYMIREWGDTELFSLDVTVPTLIGGTATLGNVDLNTLSSLNLTVLGFFGDNDEDASGLFHLGRTFEGSNLQDHILVLSHERNEILEFELQYTNPQNNDFTLNGVIQKSTAALTENQPEGITMKCCGIYIASEKGNGNKASLASYSLVTGIWGQNITLNLKIYLEGAFDPLSGQNSTVFNLYTRGLLPGQTPISNLVAPTPAGQPYAAMPWNYSGNEGAGYTDSDYNQTDIDWVLVSLRSDINVNSTFLKVAGILQEDGTIRFPNSMTIMPCNQYAYVVIEHRNHLPVMSPYAIDIINNQLTFDFTTQNSYANSTGFGQKEIVPSTWVAYGGNCSQSAAGQSHNINGGDNAAWLPGNGKFDFYSASDMNLDGDINGGDKIIWHNNNGIYSVIPQ